MRRATSATPLRESQDSRTVGWKEGALNVTVHMMGVLKECVTNLRTRYIGMCSPDVKNIKICAKYNNIMKITVSCQKLVYFTNSYFFRLYYTGGGTRWRSWLRHCAISRKIAGSIPDGVIGLFHWHNPSCRNMALGLTQSLTEMSTRNVSWG